MSDIKSGLAPWVGENPKVLILGSLPGDESIKKQAYYASPHNHFYKIMHDIFPNEDNVPDKEFILSHHIALWDMLHSAEREGSLDSNIKGEIPNDIQSFLNEHPTIHTVIVNGKSKKNYISRFKNLFPEVYWKYKIIFLPQTSSAAAISFEEKVKEWSVVKELVEASNSQQDKENPKRKIKSVKERR